jgi:hypothetical protein
MAPALLLEVEERVIPATSRRLVVAQIIWFVRSHGFVTSAS